MALLTGGDVAIRALEKKLGRPLEEDPFLSEAVRLGRERIDRAGETAAARQRCFSAVQPILRRRSFQRRIKTAFPETGGLTAF